MVHEDLIFKRIFYAIHVNNIDAYPCIRSYYGPNHPDHDSIFERVVYEIKEASYCFDYININPI